MSHAVTNPVIAIIGGGPLALYAIERLSAHLFTNPPERPLTIALFEKRTRLDGGFVHGVDQPSTSLMNRVASQVAFAADESIPEAGPLSPPALRPTFHQWSQRRFRETGEERFNLSATDMPPRALHGQAISELFAAHLERLRATRNVVVRLLHHEAIDVERLGERFVVRGAKNHQRLVCDRILFVTGHSRNRPRDIGDEAALSRWARDHDRQYSASPYPLSATLPENAPAPGSVVGLLGLGLTAIDVILHLTEGRGGRFEPCETAGSGLRYVRSGAEPETIVAVGPSGLMPLCRPLNEKALDGSGRTHADLEHKGFFLTIAAIDRLRRDAPRGLLDFDRHIAPLTVLEMAYVHHRASAGLIDRDDGGEGFRRIADPAYRAFLTSPPACFEDGVAALLAPVEAWTGTPFHWRRLFEPLTSTDATDGERWRDALLRHMLIDLRAAAEGNLRNSDKAACDGVWRDLRGVIAHAVDRGGLSAASHRRFLDIHLRRYMRLSNGAGLSAMRRVIALIEARVVDLSVGPSPRVRIDGDTCWIEGGLTGVRRAVDAVIGGRAAPFDPDLDEAPLYRNLQARGLMRRWRHPDSSPSAPYEPGPLDLDDDFHPLQRDGSSQPYWTVLGVPAEGLAFFQLTAARPHSGSAILRAVARWTNETLAIMRESLAAEQNELIDDTA